MSDGPRPDVGNGRTAGPHGEGDEDDVRTGGPADAIGDGNADDSGDPGALDDGPQQDDPVSPGGDAAVAGDSLGSGAVPRLDDGGGTILTDSASLAAERDEYLVALQRLKADFENYRKRVQRQQEEQSVRAAADIVSKILPVLDTLDLARAHLGDAAGGEASAEGQALEQARGQLIDVLAKEGLQRVDQVEVEFDPVVHDAVAHAPARESPAAPDATEQADATERADATEGADANDGSDATEQADASTGENPDERADAGPAEVTSEGPPADGAPPEGPVVDEVLRSGYRWRGQVLRPAMVRVRG